MFKMKALTEFVIPWLLNLDILPTEKLLTP